MRKILSAIAFAVAMTLPTAARAALCPPAHTFVTGETLTNTILNLNPVATSNCLANVDYTNIGTAGLKASNLKPITTGDATFGGTQSYTFPVNLSVVGGTSTNGFINTGPGTITGQANLGSVNSTGNVVWGGLSSGGTLFASSGDINHTGNLNTGGTANITGAVTAARYVTGASQLDYNVTNAGEWTFAAPLAITGFANISGDISGGGKVSALIGVTRSQVLPTLVGGSAITGQANAHTEVVFVGGGAGTYAFTKPFDSAPICVPSTLVSLTTTTTYTTNSSGSAICSGP